MKAHLHSNPFLRNLGIAAFTLALAGLSQTLKAATLTWDLSTTAGTQTGDGTWSTSVPNWSSNGTTLVNWSQTSTTVATNTATFGGADGTYAITLGGDVAAQSLTFSNSGYTLSAASAQTLRVTNAGSGVITVASGKSATIGNNATVALNSASNTGTRIDLATGGTLDIASGGVLTRTGQVTSGFTATGGTLGFMGSGTINVAGTFSFNVATPVANGGIVLAANAGNSNTLNVNGGTVSSNSTINGLALVASGTSGTLNVNSGLVSTTGTAGVTSGINLANGSGTTGTVNLNGGTISTFRINSNYLNGSNVLTTGGTSTFNFNGGTLTAIANNASYMTGLTRANVRDGGAAINTDGFDITIGQALEHSNVGGNNPNTAAPDSATDGGLTKSGAGTLTLSGTSTYNGATSVNGGTLSLTGSLASSIIVNNGGTLTGTGTTSGSLTTQAGSTFIGKAAGGILTASGGVNFAGTTTLTFDTLLTSGNTYDVVNYGAGAATNLSNVFTTYRGTVNNDFANTKVTFTAGSVGTRTWNTTSGTWEVGTAGNWAEGDTKYYNGDTVVFGNPASDSAIALNGALLPASVSVTNTNSYTFNGTGSIGGTSTLSKDGGGTLNIATTNTYTGATAINAGTLNLTGGLKDTAISLAASSALNVSSTGLISGTASLNTSGAVVLASANTYTGSTTINAGGSLQLGDGVTDGSVASTAITNNGSLVYNNIGSQAYAGPITGTGSLSKQSAGTLTLSSATSNFSGGTTVSQGTVRVGHNSALGTGAVAIASGAIVNNSAALSGLANTFTGSGTFTTVAGAGQVTLSGNWTGFSGTVSSATTADMVFNGGFTSGVADTTSANAAYVNNYTGANSNGMIVQNQTGATVTYQLGSYASVAGSNLRNSGSATGSVVFEIGNLNTDTEAAGGIGGGAQTTSLTKVGTGTLTLSGTSTYTGATLVTAGTLLVNGALGNSAVSVTGGTLGGTGTISGSVAVSGTGSLSAGASIESITTGALTMGNGTTFVYETLDSSSTGADLVAVNGTLSLAGVNLDLAGANLAAGSWTTNDKITLVSYFDGGIGITGGFMGYVDGQTYVFGANEWLFDYNDTTAGGNFSSDATANSQNHFVTMTVVPEPGAALLGGLGVLTLLRRRRA